jgi:hypothetical protein
VAFLKFEKLFRDKRRAREAIEPEPAFDPIMIIDKTTG